jgi:DNA-damage-inducible protein J
MDPVLFAPNEENAEFVRAKSMERLMKELDAGKNSGELVEEADVYRMFEVKFLSF